MEFNGVIIITDPCYVIKQEDWTNFLKGDKLGLTKFFSEDTIYGDWGCTTYKISIDPKKIPVSHYNRISINDVIGEFCADSGLVAVFDLNELVKYNPKVTDFIDSHPWCVTVIEDFNGYAEYIIDKNGEAHIIGASDTLNFITIQTSL